MSNRFLALGLGFLTFVFITQWVATASASPALVSLAHTGDKSANNPSRLKLQPASPLSNRAVSLLAVDPIKNSFNANLDGRFVVFESDADNLISGFQNNNAFGLMDIFIKDLDTGSVALVSASATDLSGLKGGNEASANPIVVADPVTPGKIYVVFESNAGDLTLGNDANGSRDIFIREIPNINALQTGTNYLVSSTTNGNAPSAGGSMNPSVGVNLAGIFIAFQSDAATSELISGGGDTPYSDIYYCTFVAGVGCKGKITLVSHEKSSALSKTGADQGSQNPMISADGTHVVFDSVASDLININTNYTVTNNVYRYGVLAKTNALLSHYQNDTTRSGEGSSDHPVVSADGLTVAYESVADHVCGPNNVTLSNVYVYKNGANVMASAKFAQNASDLEGNQKSLHPVLDPSGNYVIFESDATDLVTGVSDGNGTRDLYKRDLLTNTTSLVSINNTLQASANGMSVRAMISGDGSSVTFISTATDLDSSPHTGTTFDVFVQAPSLFGSGIRLISSNITGDNGGGGSSENPALSFTGNRLVFESTASDLDARDALGNTNTSDIFTISRAGQFNFSAATYTVNESDVNPAVTVTIQRTGENLGAASVTLQATNDTAVNGKNYNYIIPTVLNFPNQPGVGSKTQSKTATITIINDQAQKGNLDFTLSLKSPTAGATLGNQSTATVTIVDAGANGGSGSSGSSGSSGGASAGASGGGSGGGSGPLGAGVFIPGLFGGTPGSAFGSEDCNQIGDEDLNGSADCADATCAILDICQQPGNAAQEDCQAVGDENGNGASDCSDSACSALAKCQQITDADFDGIANNVDNCFFISNPDQADSDSNGIGDVCDQGGIADSDNDGVADASDNCPLLSNADQADSDGNKVGNACQTAQGVDSDGDGVIDFSDNCAFFANADQADNNANGKGEACEVSAAGGSPNVNPSSGGGGCALSGSALPLNPAVFLLLASSVWVPIALRVKKRA